jgi:hypothetical protein
MTYSQYDQEKFWRTFFCYIDPSCQLKKMGRGIKTGKE